MSLDRTTTPKAAGRNATRLAAAATLAALLALLPACEPATDDAAPDDATPALTDTMATDTMGAGAMEPAAPTGEDALVNPNDATDAQLRELGLDSATAAAISAGRPWASMVPLDRALAARMDSTTRAELYSRMFIPLDLNSAPREEILLIPGVGPRMAHEFEEYRPYRAIAQFRREIGKYVDETEVARLERYVTIR